LKFLVGKPGLDGHSNGAEQIAVRARDAGMEVVYEGIRLTPAEIVRRGRRGRRACRRPFDPVGLARAAGARCDGRMRSEGLEVPVIVGGIIPPEDENVLKQCGVAAIYTPKNYELNRILADIVRVVDDRATKAA
jgi:(2R)-ethylmalonyl-CoA mutase